MDAWESVSEIQSIKRKHMNAEESSVKTGAQAVSQCGHVPVCTAACTCTLAERVHQIQHAQTPDTHLLQHMCNILYSWLQGQQPMPNAAEHQMLFQVINSHQL